MTPGSFDSVTSREMVGDLRARVLEAQAREDADNNQYKPPVKDGDTYWSMCQSWFEHVVYTEQFKKRTARNERKNGQRQEEI